MPTRVVLEETLPTRHSAGQVRSRSNVEQAPASSPSPNGRGPTKTPTTGYSLRKALGKPDTPQATNNNTTLSRSDIQSSPSISYYLYSLLCSIVMLISIVQFFFKQDTAAVKYSEEEHYIGNYGIYRWKLIGSFGMSTAGIVIYFLILLAHFDTLCMPNFFANFFSDGSKRERNLIYFLILFWIGVLYLCTSTLSVGSVQPNVYFTSWIGFAVNIVNYNVWRTCAGYETWQELLKGHRETTWNWTWTLFFAVVAACGASDAWANQDELSVYVVGQAALYKQDRRIGLILSWTSVGISIVVLLGNHFFRQAYSMTCCNCCKVTLDWRQFEFLCLVFLLALFGYVLFVYTGTLGIFNAPSNTYFGIWGTFFSCIITLGTWIKEHKNLMFQPIARPPSPQQQSIAAARSTMTSRQSQTQQ